MAQRAPAASALARSPEYLMPPSAITGTSASSATATASMMAVSCGTPTPATTRGGADRAGADADLDRIGAGIDERASALGGGDIAGDDLHAVGELLDLLDGVEHALRVAVRGVDDDQVDAGIDQPLGTLDAAVADRGRRGDAEPPLLVLGRVRVAAATSRCP